MINTPFPKSSPARSDNELAMSGGSTSPVTATTQTSASPLNYYLSSRDVDLKEQVGRGSFGAVLRARRSKTSNASILPANCDLAVKVVDLESADEGLAEIHAEIRFLANCRHANCVSYFGSYLDGTNLYMVMEFLGGGSLLAQLAAGPLTEAQIAVAVREVLKGLEYLHRGARIHRDVKAANVLLGSNGEIKLADFGVSTTLSGVSKRYTIVGSPYWMAPEIITESGATENCDIWSLGITCIELTRGKPPYADVSPIQAMARVTKSDPVKLDTTFSAPFRDLVSCCLTKNPAKRPGATELLEHDFIRESGDIALLATLPARLAEFKLAQPPKKAAPLTKGMTQHARKESEIDWNFDTAPHETRAAPEHGVDTDPDDDRGTDGLLFGMQRNESVRIVDYAAARWKATHPEVIREFDTFVKHLEALCSGE